MATKQKQSLPSFSSIISVLSIVFYCVGFIRVELEMNEQKNRINALENVAEAKPKSNDADMKFKNAPGKLVLMKYKLGSTIILLQPQLGLPLNIAQRTRSGDEQIYPLPGIQLVGTQCEKRRAKLPIGKKHS